MDFQSRFKMPSWARRAWLGPSKLDQILFCYPGILWKLSVQPGSCLHGTQSPSPAEEEAITQMKWERKPNSPSCLYAQALVLTFKVNRRSSPILLSVELISIFLPRVKEEGVWKAGEGYLGCTFVCHPHTPSPDTRDRGKAAVWWAVWSSHSRSMAGEKVGEDSLPCHSSDTSIHFSDAADRLWGRTTTICIWVHDLPWHYEEVASWASSHIFFSREVLVVFKMIRTLRYCWPFSALPQK